MSTDKAITCRVVVQIFVCAGRQQQWLVRPVTFFSSPIDTFPLAEKEPDGGHHFGNIFSSSAVFLNPAIRFLLSLFYRSLFLISFRQLYSILV
jgi:hypothetical protein